MTERKEIYNDDGGICGRIIFAEVVVKENDSKPIDNHNPLYEGEEILKNYELIKFRIRFGTPKIQISIGQVPEHSGETQLLGKVSEVSGIKSNTTEIGRAQIWYGNNDGVIWECYPHNSVLETFGFDYKKILDLFWETIEKRMEKLGIKTIFTHDDDPIYRNKKASMSTSDFQDFLNERGYEFEFIKNYMYNRMKKEVTKK